LLGSDKRKSRPEERQGEGSEKYPRGKKRMTAEGEERRKAIWGEKKKVAWRNTARRDTPGKTSRGV